MERPEDDDGGCGIANLPPCGGVTLRLALEEGLPPSALPGISPARGEIT